MTSGPTVAITGTRSLLGRSPDAMFAAYLDPFATPGAHFHVGGATGIDTAALDRLAERSESSITVVVPCTVADQPSEAAEAITRWSARGRLVDVVELGAPRLKTPAYYARNRWMVDRSEFVIGFPFSGEPTGGAWQTLNYAAEQGKPRLIAPCDRAALLR
jgi:predicted Rossmann fold nucleotide-binding protein DprA/Smf involved in DNA uptake